MSHQIAARLAALFSIRKRQQIGDQCALSPIWGRWTRLHHMLHQEEARRKSSQSRSARLCTCTALPERYRSFHAELFALSRALQHMERCLADAQVTPEDFAFYSKWIDDLWARFRVFRSDETRVRNRLSGDVSTLREMSIACSNMYSFAATSPTYQHFLGMLHILETQIDDESISATLLIPYATAMYKQLSTLLISFDNSTH